MKTIRNWVVLVAAFLSLSISALAAPKTVENGHTAAESVTRERHASPAADTSTVKADIKLIPFEGVPKANLSFPDLMANAIDLIRTTGTLPTGTPTSDSDPRRIDHITPQSLMTWANGNGKTVWVASLVTSKTGTDDIDLAMEFANNDSNDQGNHSLKQTVTFGNSSYTGLAIGWRADNTPVTTGSASTMVTKYIVIIGFKSYNVSSDADVQEVKNYITGDFSISMGVTVGASFNSLTLGLLPPPPAIPTFPPLRVGWVDGLPAVTVGDDGAGNTAKYMVVGALKLDGPYMDAKEVQGGHTYFLDTTIAPMALFKYKAIPATP